MWAGVLKVLRFEVWPPLGQRTIRLLTVVFSLVTLYIGSYKFLRQAGVITHHRYLDESRIPYVVREDFRTGDNAAAKAALMFFAPAQEIESFLREKSTFNCECRYDSDVSRRGSRWPDPR